MNDQFVEAMLKANEYTQFNEYWDNYAKSVYSLTDAALIWTANYRRNITALRDILEPCKFEAALERQYANNIEISFMGVNLKIPYDAVAYNALIDTLNTIENEL